MTDDRPRTAEERRTAKAAAVGGMIGVVAVGVVIVLIGYPAGLIALVGSLVILVGVYQGRFG